MGITKLIGETTEYDKKQAVEMKKPKSWCKSVSAFANGIGGKLIFGIADDDTVIGLENAKTDAENISTIIGQRLNPVPDTKLSFFKTENGKTLIILDVFAGWQTPYYYAADGQLIAYQRVGNESVPVTPNKLRELVLSGSNSSYDGLPARYAFEDMAFTKLKSIYKNRTGNSFEDTDYESFGLIDENKRLTNAGALLADESPIAHSRIFCTRWNGLDKAGGVMDALDDGEYKGSLVILLQEAFNFVLRNSKKAWLKTADTRVEIPEYPERAVLEGIVNAIIHRSYTDVSTEIHLDMFDDRLEMYSPGGMCDGSKVQELDLNKVASRRRNPVLADIFSRLKYMDRRGSGFKKIISEYVQHPLYNDKFKPVLFSEKDAFYLTLWNLHYKKQAIKTGDKKQAIKTGDKTAEKIKRIREMLQEKGEMKNKDISVALGISMSRSRALLNNMPDVVGTGSKKSRSYKLRSLPAGNIFSNSKKL